MIETKKSFDNDNDININNIINNNTNDNYSPTL